jgi:O-antigen ligase
MWEEKLRRILLTFFFVSLPISVALQQTALGLLLTLLAYYGWRQAPTRSSPLDWPVMIFFATLLLSTVLSPAVRSSLFGLRKLWLVGAFFVVYHLIRDPYEAWRLVSRMLIVTAVVAVCGIFQYFTGTELDEPLTGRASDLTSFLVGGQWEFRAEGFFPTGITYAHNLCFSLTLLTARLFAPDLSNRSRVLWGVGWGLMILALLFSWTRGVWLAYLCVLVLLGIVNGGKGVVAASICGALIALLLVLTTAGMRERVQQVFALEDRRHIWSANIDMGKERPWFGWGYGNYKKFREPYYARYPAAVTHAHAHNNFLQVWVDGGVLVLLAFLFLLARILSLGWQGYQALPSESEPIRSLTLGSLFGIVGFLIGGLTQYNFGDAEVVIVFWTMAGILVRVYVWGREERQGVSAAAVRVGTIATSEGSLNV